MRARSRGCTVPYRLDENRPPTLRELAYVPELIRGLGVTVRHFLGNLFGKRDPNPDVLARCGLSQVTTIQYPEERVPYPPGYRGLHRLVPRQDGKPRCVACYLCATACPAQCIYIEAGEYPLAAEPASAVIEKYPVRFDIDELRCIVCGFCVEACPKDAIRMDTGKHVPAFETRDAFLWNQGKLVGGEPVYYESDPWNHRDSSREPEHVANEAHARIGDGKKSAIN